MKELILDGAKWITRDDVYDSFFAAVGAPSWHGRNLDALNDSIAGRQINRIEVPYKLVLRNFDLIGPGALKVANDFIDLIHELAEGGTPVEIVVEKSK
jgi:RNAse (barnase) inhibitor barstar